VEHEVISTPDDLLNMLDALLRNEGQWWDTFFRDRDKPIPFFVNAPDESLVSYFEHGQMKPGKALELGCGAGRNAIYLAKQGCEVDAVDLSGEAIAWAKERAADEQVSVTWQCQSIFDLDIEYASYDIVYDAGCLHHIPPHRRMNYISLVQKALKPDGRFGLTCFRPEGGADMSDWDVYRQRSMRGGLGYTEKRLRNVLEPAFTILEFRRMRELSPSSGLFGKDFCWTVLMCPAEKASELS
jgi:cyclopropane fatty-acyl-phospholipid synthase-like methyltransferase